MTEQSLNNRQRLLDPVGQNRSSSCARDVRNGLNEAVKDRLENLRKESW